MHMFIKEINFFSYWNWKSSLIGNTHFDIYN